MDIIERVNKKGHIVYDIVFDGRTFTKRPYARTAAKYYIRTYKKNGVYFTERLHREVYKYYKGEIPEGYDIHHIDENTDNNDISNLEAVSKSAHGKIHSPEWVERIRKLSEEHPEKMSRYTKENWKERRKKVDEVLASVKFECKACGCLFTPTNTHQKYCTTKCYNKYKRSLPEFQKEYICEYCGKTFVHNYLAPARTCSKECGHALCISNRYRNKKFTQGEGL